MSSLYLGKIGTKEDHFEIHAFSSALPFREFPVSKIADPLLFQQLIKARYQLFEKGQSIYCTAINPDPLQKTETNPHDTREGTIHIAAINKDGEISCAVSIAIDIGEREKGEWIGLPLENRWKQNNYPSGQNMDRFRELYFQKRWNKQAHVKPWQMAELYRHFKSASAKTGINARLGIYTGCYHLLVREARKSPFPASSLWVFDAITKYFNLYRLAGSAVLRDPILKDSPEFISPSPDKIFEQKRDEGIKELKYKGEKISRNITVPIASIIDGKLQFIKRQIPFLDGIVDMDICEKAANKRPYSLKIEDVSGISYQERIKLIFGSHVIGKRFIDDNGGLSKPILKIMNTYIRKKLKANLWEFNEIGI